MKQTVRHGLGIALSAMAFLCNYSPWVREAASLPDALTLTSGQKFVVQTGLPMLAASDGGAVSVLGLAGRAGDDQRRGRRADECDFFAARPDSRARNARERRGRADADSGGQAVGVALKTRGVLVFPTRRRAGRFARVT